MSANPNDIRRGQSKIGAKLTESDNASTVSSEPLGGIPEEGRKTWLDRAPIVARFWSNVHKTETCWNYITSRRGKTDPYPRIELGSHRTRTRLRWLVHRFSWELHFGPIPAGALICHRCDNPRCVRPDHLFLGTNGDNMRDMAVKQRSPRKLTPEKVRELRRRYAAHKGSFQALGAEFGICKSTAYYAVNGNRTWAYV